MEFVEGAQGLCDSAQVLDWDDLRYLVAIAHAGSLAGAARELKVEHTTVGRRLKALERALGTPLFLRGPDGITPTDTCQAILPLAEEMATRVDAIVRRASREGDRLEGTVRLTTSESLSAYVVKQLGALRREQPGLTVEILSGNRAFDLMHGEADLAIRVRLDTESELLARRLVTAGWSVYACEEYLARKGAPTSTDDLAGHDVVGFDSSLSAVPGAQWLGDHDAGTRVVLRANSIIAALNATITGMGVGVLPCFLGDPEPLLRRLTPRCVGERDVFLVVHPETARVPRIRTVMDFCIAAFARDAELWSGAGGARHEHGAT